MFEKVGIPIIGIIENMSTYVCPKCNHEEHIFGAGGGEVMAKDYNVDLLGSLPLDINIRMQNANLFIFKLNFNDQWKLREDFAEFILFFGG